MKPTLKAQAIQLRKQGYSYGFILEKVTVSKSTLTAWLSGIKYTPNKEVVERIGKARAASGAAKTRLKNETIERARVQAVKDVGSLSARDLFMLGLGIYIGEGTKSHTVVRVINADPRVISLVIKWFHKVCGLPKENFRLKIYLYPDNNIKESLNYWSKVSRIPLGQFQKVSIDRRKDKKMAKRGKLPYGKAHLSIRSSGRKEFGVFLFWRIKAWIDEVTKTAGVV